MTMLHEPPKPSAVMMPDGVAKELVDVFKLLADETRLRILFLLKQNSELNVRTLCRMLTQSQPAVSHHLALLRVAGLIEMRRDGKHNFYSIQLPRFEKLLYSIFGAFPGDPNEIRLENSVLRLELLDIDQDTDDLDAGDRGDPDSLQ
jgi:ArsR family transcriptional regulator